MRLMGGLGDAVRVLTASYGLGLHPTGGGGLRVMGGWGVGGDAVRVLTASYGYGGGRLPGASSMPLS